jgi:GT2 family glycosyltransferase
MKYSKVYAIILSFNRKDDTIECIESLKKLQYPNYEIVVVENGSNDDSAIAIRDRFPEVSLIEIEKNIGYACGFNTGLEYAYKNGASFFLILNNDTIIDSEALKELVKVAESDKQIGFVSGKVYYYDDPLKLQTVGKQTDPLLLVGKHVGLGEYDIGQYDQIEEYDFVDDVFLLVRREVYERVGGYDENFFIQWEEADWCARVRRAGFKIFYTPKAKIWHKGNLTMAQGMSPIILFYLTRNQFPFIWRNANKAQFLKSLLFLFTKKYPLTSARLLKQGEFKHLTAYVKGILSGLWWVITRIR